jgi:iron complex outermembrane receptor protein
MPAAHDRVLAALAACVFALPSIAPAQEAEEAEEVTTLEPLVVTARRFETDAASVAASISQVDAETINSKAATSVADLLSEVGVTLRSYTGNPAQSTIDMRGYGESGNLNTLVLVDGRRINAPDMSGINWLNMPLSSVDRIEVLRGSQSAMYGNNAGGGVIKVTTRIPDVEGGAAIAGAGSWNTYIARAAYWTPLGGGVSARVESGCIESDGYRDNSAYRTRSVETAFAGKVGRLSWRTVAGWDDNHFLFPGPLDSESYEEDPRQSGYYPMGADYFSDSENWHAGMSANWKGDASELNADLNYSHGDNPWNMGVGLGAARMLDSIAFAPRARFAISESLSAIVGADCEYDSLELGLFDDIAHTQRRSHSWLRRTTAGAYASLAWEGRGKRPLSADITARSQLHRLDYHFVDDNGNEAERADSKDGSDNAISIGTTWRPLESLRLYGRADRFFRYPAIDEVVAYQGYDLSVPFNADLDSESGWGAEVGAELALSGASFHLNAFAQKVEDLIAFDYTRNLNVNIADADRAGLEAGCKVVLGNWRAGLDYTILKVEFTSGPYKGSDLYLVPRHQAGGHIEWNNGRIGIRASGRYTGWCWQGNDFRNEMERMPAYFVLDIVARLRVADGIHIYAAVDNALDRRYATLRYTGVWYPAPARSYRAGIQWEF